jgi:D-alanyl-D-alanine carboxypeptidase (penicillin-binding protein 5/6)
MRKLMSPIVFLVTIFLLCSFSSAIASTEKAKNVSPKEAKSTSLKAHNKHGAKSAEQVSRPKHEAKEAAKTKAKVHIQSALKAVKAPEPASNKGEFQVNTKASMLVDMNNGEILYAQDPDTPIPPASLTKILTLYLLNEYIEEGKLKPDQLITVGSDASHAGGSNMHLRSGETDTLDDIMKGIAVASANDGCVAVADYLGNGDFAPFVAAMNKKAQELGMSSSHFFNPNGLPAEGQVVTARDMAILAQAYIKRFPQALNVHSMTEFTHNNRVRHNSNSLLGRVEGVDGLKTGFVCASGFNIVATAKRQDTRLLAVVLGARSRGVRERETTKLLEEGFKIVAAENGQNRQVAMSAR